MAAAATAALPPSSLSLSSPSLCSISLSCFLSSSALSVSLCSLSLPPPPPPPHPPTQQLSPPLFSVSLDISPLSAPAETVASERQRNAFTLRGELCVSQLVWRRARVHPPRVLLESRECEVKQRFGSTRRNTRRGKIFHEQFALLKPDI